MRAQLASRPVTARRRKDLDALKGELLDVVEVAALLGLGSPGAVSVYRSRHTDFPAPFVVKLRGRCLLWLRMDVIAWREAHPGRKP